MNRDKLFLDLDGVLVDLVLGLAQALGQAWPYNDQTKLGMWNLSKAFGLPDGTLWDKLSAEFWADLPWMPDGHQILELCENRYQPKDICILTAPTNDKSVIGKMAWMERHLPYYFDRRQFFIGWQKFRLAEPRAILVDDHQDNTDLFSLNGGKAILIPRPWNRMHNTNITPLQQLEKLL